MAKATKTVKEIKPAVPAVTEEVITLDLSRDEAIALMALCGVTRPLNKYGNATENIYLALRDFVPEARGKCHTFFVERISPEFVECGPFN